METVFFTGPLASGVLRDLKVEPGEGKDLVILPDTPAVWQVRTAFANTDSAPFITTFGNLARRHRIVARKQVLSRAGGIILMRKSVERLPGGMAKRKKLTSQLLALDASLKQCGMSAAEILKKSGTAREAGRKLALLEPALTDFEVRMKKNAVTDDTTALIDLASAISGKKADDINGKFRRIIAAGFHALTPAHLEILSAAEDSGIEVLKVTADLEQKRFEEKPAVFLRSFDFLTNEAHHAAAEIRKMIDSGANVSDFAVIVRETARRAPLIAGIFERNGVPVTVQSRVRVGAASSISAFLKDCFAAAQNPEGREFERFEANPVLQRFFFGAKKTDGKRRELKKMLVPIQITGGKPLKASAILRTLSEIVDATGAYKTAESVPAVEEARKLLREAAFLSEKWNEDFTSPDDFTDFLSELLQSRAYSYKTPGAGAHVPVMDAFQARGTSYPVVFILDCRDGVFPKLERKSGVFNDAEKRTVNKHCGEQALPTNAESLSDERSIWQCAVACAEQKLNISFSRNVEGGSDENTPSLFIKELKQTHMVEEREPDASENPYCPEITRAREFESEGKIPDELKKLLQENDPLFALTETAERGAVAEKERLMGNGVFGRFEGIVTKPEDDWWKHLRVTEIEKFGSCPFQFFCSKALEINEKETEAEIPSAMDTGTLYHDALKHIFSSDGGVWENDEKTHVALRVFLDDEETKKRHCKIPDAVWELQKERVRFLVGGFISREKHRIMERGLTPEFFEREIEMEIEGAKIRGRADRVDKGKDGSLHVVDYKKRSLPQKFCDRKTLQIPLYLAAISSELKTTAGRGSYLSVEKPESVETNADGGKTLKTATALAGDSIKLIKSGFFPAVPVSKPDNFPHGEEPIILKKERGVCDFCSYSDICRIKESAARKEGE
ncbi:PD-(D/E)XK nuclease family protein [Candidatus Mycalebacterium sp.]